jgi:N-acetylglutamate synthase-like GNAT family acetyltransferase
MADEAQQPASDGEFGQRDAHESDAPALAQLLGQFGYPASDEDTARRLGELIREPATRVLVATRGERIVGVGAVHAMRVLEGDFPLGVIIALVVDDSVRLQGVGASIVEALEAEARSRGCFAIVVHSGRKRIESHQFYQRVGYEKTGARLLKVFDAPSA